MRHCYFLKSTCDIGTPIKGPKYDTCLTGYVVVPYNQTFVLIEHIFVK